MSKNIPQYVRKMVNGKLVEPITDAYVAVVTKLYNPDTGGMRGKTWFYPAATTRVDRMPEGLWITQQIRGREQHVFIPWNEVMRIDFNDASPLFQEDRETWTVQETGMSREEIYEMNHRGMTEKILHSISEATGIDPDRIKIVDFEHGGDDANG